jgi:hypothetical protein
VHPHFAKENNEMNARTLAALLAAAALPVAAQNATPRVEPKPAQQVQPAGKADAKQTPRERAKVAKAKGKAKKKQDRKKAAAT